MPYEVAPTQPCRRSQSLPKTAQLQTTPGDAGSSSLPTRLYPQVPPLGRLPLFSSGKGAVTPHRLQALRRQFGKIVLQETLTSPEINRLLECTVDGLCCPGSSKSLFRCCQAISID